MATPIATEIIELRREGHSFQEIADTLGISKKKAWKHGRNVKMENDLRYQRQRNEGVGALRKEKLDERKLGTLSDIPFYNSSENDSERRKPEGEERKRLRELREREQLKRWRENEKSHEEGRKEQIEVGTEVARFLESMMSRKSPGGHLAKALHHGMKALGKKRELLERGGDVRLIGDNMRKLAGDENSLLGFGIIYTGKGGLLENFRKKGLTQGSQSSRPLGQGLHREAQGKTG